MKNKQYWMFVLNKALIKSMIDEDEDGMYDWIEDNGGEVNFVYPNQGQNHLGDTDFEDYFDCVGLICFDFPMFHCLRYPLCFVSDVA